MMTKSKLMTATVFLLFLTVGLLGAAGTVLAEDTGATVGDDASGAYAVNPNPPFDVVELKPGDVIPTGWNVYLEGENATLTLTTSGGQTVTLNQAGYYDQSGSSQSMDAALQGVVDSKVSAIQNLKSGSRDAGNQAGDTLESTGLDTAIPTTSLTTPTT